MTANGQLLGEYPKKEVNGTTYILYRGRWRKVNIVPWGAMIVVNGHYITVSDNNLRG